MLFILVEYGFGSPFMVLVGTLCERVCAILQGQNGAMRPLKSSAQSMILWWIFKVTNLLSSRSSSMALSWHCRYYLIYLRARSVFIIRCRRLLEDLFSSIYCRSIWLGLGTHVFHIMQRSPDAIYSTAVTALKPEDASNPNRVKCIVDKNGYALYFSRGLLPSNL